MTNVKVCTGSVLRFPVRNNAADIFIQFSGELQVFNHFDKAASASVFFAYDLKVAFTFCVQGH